MKIVFKLKQIFKMTAEHFVLPLLYFFCSRGKVQKGLAVFADAHHNSCPFSMKLMRRKTAEINGVEIKDFYLDFSKCSPAEMLKFLVRFSKVYGKAEYVFICDNFLPVSSCKKRPETTVVQLWHSGGLLKKAGYDCEDSIPKMYKGEVFKNYDLLTVSSPNCVSDMARSMHQKEQNVKPLGISRTDCYFSESYNRRCRAKFFESFPQARGKTVVLWTPTFRGNAAEPYVVGEDELDRALNNEKYFIIKKLHPHMKSNDERFCDFPPEKLFCAADILITDYSSIVFDFLAYKKPFVFFAPDLEEFEKRRGFYADYSSFPTTVAKNADELAAALEYELKNRSKKQLEECYKFHMSACDGRATERILKEIGLSS